MESHLASLNARRSGISIRSISDNNHAKDCAPSGEVPKRTLFSNLAARSSGNAITSKAVVEDSNMSKLDDQPVKLPGAPTLNIQASAKARMLPMAKT